MRKIDDKSDMIENASSEAFAHPFIASEQGPSRFVCKLPIREIRRADWAATVRSICARTMSGRLIYSEREMAANRGT